MSIWGDRLDAAEDGVEFGNVVNDFFSYLDKLVQAEKDNDE